jgi:SAM-dependent methyltransferase
MLSAGKTAAFVEQAYWIVLGRAPTRLELQEELTGHPHADRGGLNRGLLATAEFRRLRAEWKAGRESHDDPAALERALTRLGQNENFVQAVYSAILGRDADAAGSHHYCAVLAGGEPRTNVIRALALSGEFEARLNAIPRDRQLCELANPAKWDNEEWLGILRSLGLSDDKAAMHRKPYEFTQLIYGCRQLGFLRPDASFVSIGAGHEQVLYWLSNHVARVVGTDLYEGEWTDERAREGDPTVLMDPDRYAPFPYRRDRLQFLRMDGRQLQFESGTFDVAYSLSSIEHFGGVPGAVQTLREMARVTKNGGLVAVATEYALGGPPHEEVFQPQEIHELVRASGLTLVEPIDERVYHRYETRPVRLQLAPYLSPHMVVEDAGTVFTSVMMFLRK